MGEAVADKHPVELVSVFLATTTKHRVVNEVVISHEQYRYLRGIILSQRVSYEPE